MPISQTTITGSVKTPANIDAVITSIEFTLSGSDFEDGEIVAANKVSAEVLEAGDFTVDLWPNDQGINADTSYKVSFVFSDGSKVTGLDKIRITHSDTPKTIEDVAFETKLLGAFKGYKAVVLTQSQYTALTTKDPNTVYLIKA